MSGYMAQVVTQIHNSPRPCIYFPAPQTPPKQCWGSLGSFKALWGLGSHSLTSILFSALLSVACMKKETISPCLPCEYFCYAINYSQWWQEAKNLHRSKEKPETVWVSVFYLDTWSWMSHWTSPGSKFAQLQHMVTTIWSHILSYTKNFTT